MNAVELTDVDKTFDTGTQGTVHALSGIGLRVEPGEFVSLIGPSGATRSSMPDSACTGPWAPVSKVLSTPVSSTAFIGRPLGTAAERGRAARPPTPRRDRAPRRSPHASAALRRPVPVGHSAHALCLIVGSLTLAHRVTPW